MIACGWTVAALAAVSGGWPGRIAVWRPKNVVELGTGQGAGGAQIMAALSFDARFTTINYADGHTFGEQLQPFIDDHRLSFLHKDTIDPATLDLVPDDIDLLFIDTTHEAWHAATELRLWQHKLDDGAIVVVDDLDQHDMAAFWNSLPYERVGLEVGFRQGVFRYDRARLYKERFDRPDNTTYGTSLDPKLRK